MKPLTATELIAPCGMNCGICYAYLREKNKCAGCRASNLNKPVTRVRCKLKTCANFKTRDAKYCFDCRTYPCGNLKHLDKRYRIKYNMSMIENLDKIKRTGVRTFVKSERKQWACPECGGTICVHKQYCLKCQTAL
jgi:Protein of unknown function (DUF3795)